MTGQKIWDDEGNAHGTRPSSVTVQLLRNGTPVDSMTVSGNGGTWSYSFTGLPAVDENGNAYSYTVSENAVEGYTSIVNGTTITNTLIPKTPEEFTEITGSKTWNDNNNADGVRPNHITVHLLRNGVEIDQRTVTAANGWTYSFGDLPLDDGYGNHYTYAIVEDGVAGYFSRSDGRNLTNMRLPNRPSTPTPDTPKTGTPVPPFEEKTEEELEELLELYDYDSPLFGMLQTGDDTPAYPFVFGGIGLAALLALLLLGRKKKLS